MCRAPLKPHHRRVQPFWSFENQHCCCYTVWKEDMCCCRLHGDPSKLLLRRSPPCHLVAARTGEKYRCSCSSLAALRTCYLEPQLHGSASSHLVALKWSLVALLLLPPLTADLLPRSWCPAEEGRRSPVTTCRAAAENAKNVRKQINQKEGGRALLPEPDVSPFCVP